MSLQPEFSFNIDPSPVGSTINSPRGARPFSRQLLKWIGNKQRFAREIIAHFPERFGTYYEPFLGSGGVLGVLSPKQAEASDSFRPLIEIWQTLKNDPSRLKNWYASRWAAFSSGDRLNAYERIKASFNRKPNGADLLFLCRACYGGVVRFRKADGYMSTPIGIHNPIEPGSFARRVDEWHARVQGTNFQQLDYAIAISGASKGDLVYCDPPYSYSQGILYKAQDFNFSELIEMIARAKKRGVYVALSIDGSKKSGRMICDLHVPPGLFQREITVNTGRSMLRRFQMEGQTLESEIVNDRLLLTY